MLVNLALGQTEQKAKARAAENMYLLKTGKYPTIIKRMDATMSRMIDASQLQGLWEGLQMQYGNLQNMGETSVKTKDSLFVCITPLQYEKTKLLFRLVLDTDLKIAGLFIEPPETPYAPAAWVDPSLFYEVKKPVPVAEFPSEGMLTFPNVQQKLPLVIIIGGSGPTDMDLHIGPNRIYKDIAWGLATQEIAVYRYDKRTVAFANKMGAEDKVTAKQEYLDDLKAIVTKLAKHELIDSNRIFLLGHSQGAYLIPWFVSEIKEVKGAIIAAGNYRPLAEMIEFQLLHLQTHAKTSEEKKQIQAILDRLPYARTKLTAQSPADSLPLGMSANYLLHLNQHAPVNHLKDLAKYPVLVLQGARDYQVPQQEFEEWKKALAQHPDATFELYHQLNHIFMAGEGVSLPAEYEEAGNVSKMFILDIAKWVKRH